jgi:hypothetical protein
MYDFWQNLMQFFSVKSTCQKFTKEKIDFLLFPKNCPTGKRLDFCSTIKIPRGKKYLNLLNGSTYSLTYISFKRMKLVKNPDNPEREIREDVIKLLSIDEERIIMLTMVR